MKSKSTRISMVIFLCVFCLSTIFDIQRPLSSSCITNSNKDPALIASEESSDGFDIQSFSYEDRNISTYDNGVYLFSKVVDYNPSVIDYRVMEDAITEESTSNDTDVSVEAQIQNSLVSAQENDNSLTESEYNEATSEESQDELNEEASKFSNIGISIANSYVNIRKEASTDSAVLGKLYRDSSAVILNAFEDWFYVESGSIKGYLKSEFIKTGIPDDELIEKYGTLRAIVNVDGLNVRENPDIESKKLTVIYHQEVYSVLEVLEEWVKIDISDDNVKGYVKKEFIELSVSFKKAVSKEEEQELLRLKEAERIKKETEVKHRGEVSYTNEELKLLICLVHAEAGNQTYEGKLAVANIVINRVKSSKYPNNIKAVIYQPGQFSVAKSGSLDKQLNNYSNYNSNSQLLTIKAAKAALSGANNIGSRLYFNSYKAAIRKGYDKKPNAVKLDDQLFW